MNSDDHFLSLLEDDSVFPLSPFSPAKVKDRPPNRSHNICCCPGCGCKDRDPSEDRIMSDPDTDTASIHSSDSENDFPVAGEQGIEDSYESLTRSFHGGFHGHQHSHQLERFLESDQDPITWLPLAPAMTTGDNAQASPLSPGSTDSMVAEGADSDSMTLSTRSLPRAPSPGDGYLPGVGALFGEEAAAAAPCDEMHCRNGQAERRSDGDVSGG